MPRQSPLIRQWILLKTLCAWRHGATINELAEEMEVGEKTIRRDLEAFQTAGFPLVETVGPFGRKSYRIDPDKNQPGLCFAYDEAIALYLGRRFLEPLAGTVFWEAAQRAFRKIRASLGKEALRYVAQFAAMFHQTMVGVGDYSKKAKLIDDLMVGIEDRRAVFITYQSLQATEPVTYDIYPLGLTYHRGSLYLVGQKVERRLKGGERRAEGGGGETGESARCFPLRAPTAGWSGEGLGVRAASDENQTIPSPTGRGQGEGERRLSQVSRNETGTVPLCPHVPSPLGRGQGEGKRGLSQVSSDETGTVPLSTHHENPIRHWKIDRIEDAKLEELRFNRPEDFDLHEHFAKSFGVFQGEGDVHVKIRFSPTVARYVQESTWHASQKLTKEKDGSLLVEFDLSDTQEIMRWILGFGRHAVVLEPESLRRDIGGEIEALCGSYGPSSVTGRAASSRGKPTRSAPQHDGR